MEWKINEYKNLHNDLIFKVQHMFLVLMVLVEVVKTYLSLKFSHPKMV